MPDTDLLIEELIRKMIEDGIDFNQEFIEIIDEYLERLSLLGPILE